MRRDEVVGEGLRDPGRVGGRVALVRRQRGLAVRAVLGHPSGSAALAGVETGADDGVDHLAPGVHGHARGAGRHPPDDLLLAGEVAALVTSDRLVVLDSPGQGEAVGQQDARARRRPRRSGAGSASGAARPGQAMRRSGRRSSLEDPSVCSSSTRPCRT